jgi:hypothetical protein
MSLEHITLRAASISRGASNIVAVSFRSKNSPICQSDGGANAVAGSEIVISTPIVLAGDALHEGRHIRYISSSQCKILEILVFSWRRLLGFVRVDSIDDKVEITNVSVKQMPYNKVPICI